MLSRGPIRSTFACRMDVNSAQPIGGRTEKTDLAIIRLQSDKHSSVPFEFGDSDSDGGRRQGPCHRRSIRPDRFGHSRHHQRQMSKCQAKSVRGFPPDRCGHQPGQQRRTTGKPRRQSDRPEFRDQKQVGRLPGRWLWAISSEHLAKTVVEQLLNDGAVKRGYLGIKIHDIDAELAAKLGVKEASGVLITTVVAQSPAAKSGLKLNDIVITIGGKPIRNAIDLQKVVAALPLNQPVDVALRRDGQPLQLRLTIEEQPEEFGDGQRKGKR